MSQQQTLEEIVVEQADVVRHQIEEAADFAESEMDLQIEVAKALDHFSSVAHLPKLQERRCRRRFPSVQSRR